MKLNNSKWDKSKTQNVTTQTQNVTKIKKFKCLFATQQHFLSLEKKFRQL